LKKSCKMKAAGSAVEVDGNLFAVLNALIWRI
jgi:hypothetical protein